MRKDLEILDQLKNMLIKAYVDASAVRAVSVATEL
jgi:hypothetical protein